ncbi:Ig-like domain-containing protein [Herbaspirillum huttiense]|uniref:Ig-like domain-containing protein n=1 Tax=Herbaspirillum huttiense TaxID=863372 RepID=UPI00217698A7|nr:Ig-like domain-containing protein [Herbaspirillum huttiense]UWE17536.1 Ig-like domain-containing protein [Herbaspirillum huttiense]
MATRDGAVEVLGIEPGATWQYKLEDGNWLNGSSTTLNLGGSDGTKSIVVRQTDKAGNASAESEALEFTLDRIAPVAPTLSKVAAVLSGGKTYSKDRSFTVSGLEADGLAEYRLGEDAWVRFPGNSFTLPASQADGEYRVSVRQTDRAGNVSGVSAEVTFTLDTKADAPTLQLNTPAGTNPAGETLTTKGSFSLAGIAEKGARVKIFNGAETVGEVTASNADGSWSLALPSTLEISGLKRVDGRVSTANGTYQLMTLEEVRGLGDFNGQFLRT